LIVFSTIDGGMHALEARTGALRWTVPSGDPVVNFAKPEEERRERQRPVQSELSEKAGSSATSGDSNSEDEGGSSDGARASSGSTDVARVLDDPHWQEQEGSHDDFEGFIPVYAGIPGGGFLHMPEDGEWKIFERTAEQLVQLSPWYDKASRGIIVGSKETKVFALDPDSGKMSWLEDDSAHSGARCRQSSGADTLVITRSMYSIKVRHAETGAFFWNVSISEFRAHSTDTDQDAGAERCFRSPSLCVCRV
jgi:outer membrane protein assembly factor BamB